MPHRTTTTHSLYKMSNEWPWESLAPCWNLTTHITIVYIALSILLSKLPLEHHIKLCKLNLCVCVCFQFQILPQSFPKQHDPVHWWNTPPLPGKISVSYSFCRYDYYQEQSGKVKAVFQLSLSTVHLWEKLEQELEARTRNRNHKGKPLLVYSRADAQLSFYTAQIHLPRGGCSQLAGLTHVNHQSISFLTWSHRPVSSQKVLSCNFLSHF